MAPIHISPRWPYRHVAVSELAYERLLSVQHHLNVDAIQLVLTRGYEYESRLFKILHRLSRLLSALCFCVVYPSRAHEHREIFSANGHDVDGNHIDLSIKQNGVLIRLLPSGPFTTSKQIAIIHQRYRGILDTVGRCLKRHNFVVHVNSTEAHQIHCDLHPTPYN